MAWRQSVKATGSGDFAKAPTAAAKDRSDSASEACSAAMYSPPAALQSVRAGRSCPGGGVQTRCRGLRSPARCRRTGPAPTTRVRGRTCRQASVASLRVGASERLPRVMLDRAVAPDGKRLAAGALDGRLRLWRLPFGDPAEDHCRMLGAITAVAYSPDGRTLVSGCATGLVTLHRLAEGTRIDKTHRQLPGFMIGSLASDPSEGPWPHVLLQKQTGLGIYLDHELFGSLQGTPDVRCCRRSTFTQ